MRKLPNLLFSLLPIVLPVALIGTNTALETRANGQRAAQISAEEVKDWAALSSALVDAMDGPLQALGERTGPIPESPSDEEKSLAVGAINKALRDRVAFDTGKNMGRWNLALVEHENRLQLESALPETVLAVQDWDTPARKAANTS